MLRAMGQDAWVATMCVYLLATLDTKGEEASYVRSVLAAAGVAVRIVDTGCLGTPTVAADVSREELFAAGGTSLAVLAAKNDRGLAVTAAAEGAAKMIAALHAAGQVSGVLAIGGSAGTSPDSNFLTKLEIRSQRPERASKETGIIAGRSRSSDPI